MPTESADALLLVSFGGPNGPDDVIPFLENVLRGRNVPRERMLEVAEHYQKFGGVSPINEQNQALIAAIKEQFHAEGMDVPVYWGNRNWHPLLPDTLAQMKADGIERALAFFTSMYSCYSGCRQYRENIAAAQQAVGEGAPRVDKLRMAFNHPAYIEASIARVQDALATLPASSRDQATFLFTAHSIPQSMADHCNYTLQLQETCRLIMEGVGPHAWELVFQSRSGPPSQPWLEPDVCDRIESLHQAQPIPGLVIMPVGFVSDHMEVLYDLDVEAAEVCQQLNIPMARAKSVGTHPSFVKMITELYRERIGTAPKRAIGQYPANWDVCPADCCTYTPARRPTAPDADPSAAS